MDIKKGDVLISMTYLYQDKQLIEKHGIGIVVWEQYYRQYEMTRRKQKK